MCFEKQSRLICRDLIDVFHVPVWPKGFSRCCQSMHRSEWVGVGSKPIALEKFKLKIKLTRDPKYETMDPMWQTKFSPLTPPPEPPPNHTPPQPGGGIFWSHTSVLTPEPKSFDRCNYFFLFCLNYDRSHWGITTESGLEGYRIPCLIYHLKTTRQIWKYVCSKWQEW